LKPWDYNFLLKLNPFVNKNNIIEIIIKHKNKIITQEKYINPKWFINLKWKNVKIWKYKLIIKVKNNDKSLIETKKLTWWKIIRTKKNINPKYFVFKETEKGCSYYEWVKLSDVKYYHYKNKFKIKIKRWTSCSWISATDNKLHKVNPWENYIIKYNLIKNHTNKLHSRIEYYDENKKFLKYNFLYNHSIDDDDNNLIKVEKIFKIPKKAKFMKFSFLQRQRQEIWFIWNVEISNLEIHNYYELPWIDSIIIYDEKSHLFFKYK
jgi:hypothetical protein